MWERWRRRRNKPGTRARSGTAIWPLSLQALWSERWLGLPKRHNQAAEHDERTAEVDGLGGRLVELQLGDDLGDQEEEHDIDAQQLAEVHLGRVEEEAIADQDESAGEEPAQTPGAAGVIEPGLEAGVSLDLEIGSKGEHGEGTRRGGDELAEQIQRGPRAKMCVSIAGVVREGEDSPYPSRR